MQPYVIKTQDPQTGKVSAVAYGRENLTEDQRDLFLIAVNEFTQVLELGREYSADQWVTVLTKYYKPCPKVQAVMDVIRIAMVHPIVKGEL